MIGAFIVSLALLGLSGALIDSHRRTWRAAQESADLSARSRRFAQAQYRRRLQASGMIGVIGTIIALWPVVPREPGPMMFYTAALLAGCVWIMLLALLDLLATRHYYRRLRDEQLAKHVEMALEIRALQGAEKMTNSE